ncbi:O-antigen polysaccharide polymerase Wzy [Thiococcus pfennigii]|uniref:O-antigen polysaccharide polymerase Wzy n=1 Tax=Thiococcus pfennigii TaxID=1057 RepID=UPI001908A749|nr:O-antigen polysaccharide polymerase Wzy [Thiococcus pfennigii]MBK1699835.1 hypothetical protein [Thiococcus pfennigii]
MSKFITIGPSLLLACIVLYMPSNDLKLVSLAYVITAIFIIINWLRLKLHWLNLFFLFLLALILFSAGPSVNELLGYPRHANSFFLDGPFSHRELANALHLSIACILGFHIGALTVYSRNAFDANEITYEWRFDHAGRKVGLFLIALSLPFFLFDLYKEISLFGLGGRGLVYEQLRQDAAARSLADKAAIFFSGWLVPGALLLFSCGSRNRIWTSVASLSILAVVVGNFAIGAREAAFVPLVMFIWLRHRLGRPINVKLIPVALVLYFTILHPLLSVLRQDPSLLWSFSLTVYAEVLADLSNPLLQAMHELGNSLRPVLYTIDRFPSEENYRLGFTYLTALTSVMPNIFGGVHIAAENSLRYWFTSQVVVGGGYSPIAEAYANFGSIGAPIVFGFFGATAMKMAILGQTVMRRYQLAIAAIAFSSVLIIVRGDSLQVVRAITYYAVFPALMVYLTAKMSKKWMW